MKYSISFILILLAFAGFAQEKNILLDRNFWKESPDLTMVRKKVSQGHSATEFNNNGFDATTLALIANADNDVVGYLLSLKGNAVDKRTHDSRIYLHWATYGGNMENVKTLLELGSAVDALDSRGNSPLVFGAGAGLKNYPVYELFKARGVDLAKEENQQGANLLLLASPYLEKEEDLEFFLKNGMTLNSTDDEGNNIFNYASRRGNTEFLKVLIDKGVDYKTDNKNGDNAFMFAAQGTRGFNNSIEIYQFLQELGLEPNVITKDGSTPLHRIAYTKVDKDIFDFFLKAGANVDQKDAEGNTPFLNASARNSFEVVQLMAENSKQLKATNNKGQSALMLAVAHNSPDVVEFLLQKGLEINAKDAAGNTLASYLLDSYNPKNIESFEAKLKMLREKELPLNTLQAEGNTLYHLAAKTNNPELIKIISNFDIHVNAVNKEGMTALQQAAMKAQDDQIMKYLIAIGADTKATTEFGETAYDLASENEMLQRKKVKLDFLK